MALGSKKTTRRGLLGGAALLLGSAGCGWILYPERQGRRSGYLDTRVLIVDLIWLLPGLLPGIICLVVDFSTGCIYEGGGRASEARDPAAQAVAVTVDVRGTIVARGEVQPDGRAHLVWSDTPDVATLREHGRMVATARGDALAEARINDLI